jgi:hypothetical protein
MTLASDVITRGLRLINVPGRGAVLSGQDSQNAFETLQEIVAAESVSKQFVPGIRRHFFPLQGGKAIYSYGPGAEFDTNDFFDLTPVRVEDCYIREGAVIQNNEQVSNGDFNLATNWTLGTGWSIANGSATIAPGNNGETLSQTLNLVAGRNYTVRVRVAHRDGSVNLRVIQDGAINIVDQTLDAGAVSYVFTATFSGTVSSEIQFIADADADMDIEDVSIIETGLDKVFLPDPANQGGGSDYTVTIINQKRYNRRFTKGTGGRPYELLFSRNYPNAEIRFDNSAIPGDILVMDVLAAPQVLAQTDTVPLHPDAIKWLKYQLAHEMSGEYAKRLTREQQEIRKDAWTKLSSGNRRKNTLRFDRALRIRPTFDVNRGDP